MNTNLSGALNALRSADEESSLHQRTVRVQLEEAAHVLEEKRQHEIMEEIAKKERARELKTKAFERRRLVRMMGGGISYQKVYPIAKIVSENTSDDSVDLSDRAVLPGLVLQELLELDADFPFLFQLTPEGEDILSPEHRTHISVARFSREEVIYVPGEIMKRLGFHDSNGASLVENPMVTLIYTKLQKATHAKFRPLQRGFTDSVPNVLVFLEKWLQSKYAIISPGLVLPVVIRKPGAAPMKFDLMVQSVKPPLPAVSTIETDINISIKEPNAGDMSKIVRLSDPSPHSGTRQLAVDEPNSFLSIPLDFNKPVSSSLGPNEAHFFKIQLDKENQKPLLSIYLDIKNEMLTLATHGNAKGNEAAPNLHNTQDGDADMYVGFYPIRFPTRTSNTYICADEIGSKKLEMKTNELQGQSIIFLSIASEESAARYILRVVYEDIKGEATAHGSTESTLMTTLCSNCKQYVPSANAHMHEAFCRRNVARCQHPGCNMLIRVRDADSHVHCQVCAKAVTRKALPKHHRIYHEPSSCGCGASLPLHEMQIHMENECPLRLIVCRFCHSEQEAGSGTISPEDVSLGITSAHEASCGSHTLKCDICKHTVLRKRFEVHMKEMHPYHEKPGHVHQQPSGTDSSSEHQQRQRPILRRQGSSSQQLHPMRCPICAARFNTEFRLQQHIDEEHNEESVREVSPTQTAGTAVAPPTRTMPGFGSEDARQNPFACMLCQSTFPTGETLQIHYDHEHPE